MTDKTQVAIGKGARAKALLESDAFDDAVNMVRADLMERWVNCADATQRDRIWISVNLLEKIKGALISTIDNGKIAQSELDALLARDKAA